MRLKIHIILTATLALGALPSAASAQERFPSRPLKIVVGLTPGGSSDIAARVIGEHLAKRLGQPVVIENKPGAGHGRPDLDRVLVSRTA